MVIYGNNNTLQSLNNLLYQNNVYKTSLNILLKYLIKLGRTKLIA